MVGPTCDNSTGSAVMGSEDWTLCMGVIFRQAYGGSSLWKNHLTFWPVCSKFQMIHSIPNTYFGFPCCQEILLYLVWGYYLIQKHQMGWNKEARRYGNNICNMSPLAKWVQWPDVQGALYGLGFIFQMSSLFCYDLNPTIFLLKYMCIYWSHTEDP